MCEHNVDATDEAATTALDVNDGCRQKIIHQWRLHIMYANKCDSKPVSQPTALKNSTQGIKKNKKIKKSQYIKEQKCN